MFNLIIKVTLISFAPNFMLVTTSKVCADGSQPFPSRLNICLKGYLSQDDLFLALGGLLMDDRHVGDSRRSSARKMVSKLKRTIAGKGDCITCT